MPRAGAFQITPDASSPGLVGFAKLGEMSHGQIWPGSKGLWHWVTVRRNVQGETRHAE